MAETKIDSFLIADGTITNADIDASAAIDAGKLDAATFSGTLVESFNTLQGDVTISAGANITLTPVGNDVAIAAAAGIDELAKVSANDTTSGYLNGKLVAGTGMSLVENNDAGNETLSLDVDTPIDFASATTTVNVSAATAPTLGQVLTATSDSAATWQTPAAGGDVSAGVSETAGTLTKWDTVAGDLTDSILTEATTQITLTSATAPQLALTRAAGNEVSLEATGSFMKWELGNFSSGTNDFHIKTGASITSLVIGTAGLGLGKTVSNADIPVGVEVFLKGAVSISGTTFMQKEAVLTELGATPDSKGGTGKVYVKTDSILYFLDDSSVEHDLLSQAQTFASAASGGGAASAALTVTGLLSTDTILSVSQSTAGANSTAIIAWNTQINNGLTIVWTGDPGAGAIVAVTIAAR